MNLAHTNFLQGESTNRKRTKATITMIWKKLRQYLHLPLEYIFLSKYDTEDTLPQCPAD